MCGSIINHQDLNKNFPQKFTLGKIAVESPGSIIIDHYLFLNDFTPNHWVKTFWIVCNYFYIIFFLSDYFYNFQTWKPFQIGQFVEHFTPFVASYDHPWIELW